MDITKDNIADLAPKVMSMLEEWKLKPEYVLRMMGLEDLAKPRDLVRFRSKEKTFPFSTDIVERFEQIIGIYDALHTSHPHSRDMRSLWLRRGHRRFNKVSPLALMLADGTDGMIRVHIELDCSYGWSLTDGATKS